MLKTFFLHSIFPSETFDYFGENLFVECIFPGGLERQTGEELFAFKLPPIQCNSQTVTSSPAQACKQIKANKSNQTKPNQTKPNQTKSNQTNKIKKLK